MDDKTLKTKAGRANLRHSFVARMDQFSRRKERLSEIFIFDSKYGECSVYYTEVTLPTITFIFRDADRAENFTHGDINGFYRLAFAHYTNVDEAYDEFLRILEDLIPSV